MDGVFTTMPGKKRRWSSGMRLSGCGGGGSSRNTNGSACADGTACAAHGCCASTQRYSLPHAGLQRKNPAPQCVHSHPAPTVAPIQTLRQRIRVDCHALYPYVINGPLPVVNGRLGRVQRAARLESDRTDAIPSVRRITTAARRSTISAGAMRHASTRLLYQIQDLDSVNDFSKNCVLPCRMYAGAAQRAGRGTSAV